MIFQDDTFAKNFAEDLRRLQGDARVWDDVDDPFHAAPQGESHRECQGCERLPASRRHGQREHGILRASGNIEASAQDLRPSFIERRHRMSIMDILRFDALPQLFKERRFLANLLWPHECCGVQVICIREAGEQHPRVQHDGCHLFHASIRESGGASKERQLLEGGKLRKMNRFWKRRQTFCCIRLLHPRLEILQIAQPAVMTGNDKRRDVCLPPRFCCCSLQEISGTDAGMWNTMKTLATDVALKAVGGFSEIMERSDKIPHRGIAACEATRISRYIERMFAERLCLPVFRMCNHFHKISPRKKTSFSSKII